MSSLDAHMRQAGSHGHLPFHRGCAVCRAERLSGALRDDAFVSPRTRAGLAAALVAATAVPAVPAAASGEPDMEYEGTADETKPPVSIPDPGFDEGSLETDPATEEEPPEPEAFRLDAVPAEPSPVPAEPPPLPDPLPPVDISPPPPALEDLGDRRSTPLDDRSPQRPSTLPLQKPDPPGDAPPSREPPRRDHTPVPPPSPAMPDLGDGAKPTAPSESLPIRPATDPPTRSEGRSDDRTHVVQRGECLWSIAYDRLSGDPSPAQVARLVNRLWELNAERIGTGEPDLLMAGTELRMP